MVAPFLQAAVQVAGRDPLSVLELVGRTVLEPRYRNARELYEFQQRHAVDRRLENLETRETLARHKFSIRK